MFKLLNYFYKNINKNPLKNLRFLLFIFTILLSFGEKVIVANAMVAALPDRFCCSNVLFLPGIEASRLYLDSKSILGTSTNQLWEPNRSADVEKMFMDKDGKSLNNGIYTYDILDKVIGFGGIYKDFINMMNGIIANGYINDWLAFPYDWRMNINDITYNDTKYSTTTLSLLRTVQDLAKTSRTGKVTIIAHSNGGLLAKNLSNALEKNNLSDLIDKIILVAVPELGTAQTVSSMLHGEHQSLFGGLILSKNTARIFSQNMPAAYGLLPSRKFFENNKFSVINDLFSSTSSLAFSFDSFKDFLLNNSFSKDKTKKLSIPLLLNSKLFEESDTLHSIIDYWKPSNLLKIISIRGWGLPTTYSITYKRSPHCDIRKIKSCNIEVYENLNNSGDGTVLTDSDSHISDQSFFVNLKKIKDINKEDINHSNILESGDTLGILKDQIINDSPIQKYGDFVTETEPIDTETYLTIRVHSPVDIDVYDNEGNHTGPREIYAEGREMPYIKYDSNITSSFYREMADSKTVILPYGKQYKILLKGNDTGVFSIDAEISRLNFDNVIASTTFSDMPVTPLMTGEIIISTSTSSFSISSIIKMDVNNDGEIDFINHTDKYLDKKDIWPISDYKTYISSIRKVILSLDLSEKEEKSWNMRIDKIEKYTDKKYPSNRFRKDNPYLKENNSNKKHKISKINLNQKKLILDGFNDLLSDIESEMKDEGFVNQ